ncbi:hypothetical protein RQP46_005421 [Phenoliferia psychrophenolica]
MSRSSFVVLALVTAAFAAHSGTITHAALAASATSAAAAGSTPLPLTKYSYAYDQVPYQVNPYQYLRGPQTGYNQCNSTTGGPTSECQTLILNSIEDFCLWGNAGTTLSTIGDIEAATIAYCTKDTHGARTIRPGAITGLQFMKTTAYIQLVGFIDQTALMLTKDDSGGELDPHGADLLGNPLGGLVYSTGLPSAKDNTTLMQVVEWNNFIGGGQFCIKLCDPSQTSVNYCQNIFDILGCSYNMPNAAKDNAFISCEGDLQDEVATYTGADGKKTTWSQPSILPATSTLPWQPRVPASSNCVTYQSTDILGVAPVSTGASGSVAASSGASGKSGAATSTGGKAGAAASSTPGASSASHSLVASLAVGLMGSVFALLM